MSRGSSSWKRSELLFLVIYAICFYALIIYRSLQLTREHSGRLTGLRRGWMWNRLNDLSDAQWRNFRGNLPILTLVMGMFTLVATTLRSQYHLKGRGMSVIWLLVSLSYLLYLHGACVMFVLSIASMNFVLVKIFAQSKYFSCLLWMFNIFFLIWNRIYEGYSFRTIGQSWAFLDNYRGTFRWHICFNFGGNLYHMIEILELLDGYASTFTKIIQSGLLYLTVILRMISFGYDYHWAHQDSRFDQEKHIQRCRICSSGKTCYLSLQERSIHTDKFSFSMYLCYLVYAPLYIAGPIVSFNAFASQLDMPQRNHSIGQIAWYGFRWVLSLFLMEVMTHFFCYNAFTISGLWREFSPFEVFIIGYGVLNFMWLKFFLIWRYFRFWSLVGGVDVPENMPRCINNCYDLESFWKNWHASFNKWLVRYLYIPLGGSRKKLLNVWVIFTFVAVWHDLEWRLLSWAWLTCLFFIPEMIVKSAVSALKAKSAIHEFILRELGAVAGAITITSLMVANLVGYVIGPSGINWLISRLLHKDGLPVLGGIFTTFYVGTKLMFHIQDTKKTLQ